MTHLLQDRNTFPSVVCLYPLSVSGHSTHAHNFNEIHYYFSISDVCNMRNLSLYFFSFLSMLLCHELDSVYPPNVASLPSFLVAMYVSNQPLLTTVFYNALFTPNMQFPLWLCLHSQCPVLNPLYRWQEDAQPSQPKSIWRPSFLQLMTSWYSPGSHHLPHPSQCFSSVYLTLGRALWTHVRSQETGFQPLASTKDTRMPTPWRLHLAGLACPWSSSGYIPKA